MENVFWENFCIHGVVILHDKLEEEWTNMHNIWRALCAYKVPLVKSNNREAKAPPFMKMRVATLISPVWKFGAIDIARATILQADTIKATIGAVVLWSMCDRKVISLFLQRYRVCRVCGRAGVVVVVCMCWWVWTCQL